MAQHTAQHSSRPGSGGTSAHHAALARRHAGLEAQLDALHARPRPDDAELKRIKREKLRLKDQMASA